MARYSNKLKPNTKVSESVNTTVAVSGIRTPTHLRRTSGDEETFIPLALAPGVYRPLDVTSGGNIFNDSSISYAQKQLSQLRKIGFDPQITTSSISAYYNLVAEMVSIWVYLTNVYRLQDNMHIHTGIPIGPFVANNINGRMNVFYRNLTRQLQSLPFPKKWVETCVKGLGITLMSDNPNSPIRLFAPSVIYDGYGVENQLTINEKVDAFQTQVDAFYSVASNILISQILDHESYTFEANRESIKYEEDTVNSWLNQGFFDGTGTDPQLDNDVEIPLYFRRNLNILGLSSFTTSIGSVGGTAMWTPVNSTAAVGIGNDGITFDPRLDSEDFTQYGAIWEASIALAGAPHPSVTRVFTTGNAVYTQLSEHQFG